MAVVPPLANVRRRFVQPAGVYVWVSSGWKNLCRPQLGLEVSYPSGSGLPPRDTSSVPGPIDLWQTALQSTPASAPVDSVGTPPGRTPQERPQTRQCLHGDGGVVHGIESGMPTLSRLGRTGRSAIWLARHSYIIHCLPVLGYVHAGQFNDLLLNLWIGAAGRYPWRVSGEKRCIRAFASGVVTSVTGVGGWTVVDMLSRSLSLLCG